MYKKRAPGRRGRRAGEGGGLSKCASLPHKPSFTATQAPRAAPIFVLRLQSPRGDDVRRLRLALKALLRRPGLRCISIEIEVRP